MEILPSAERHVDRKKNGSIASNVIFLGIGQIASTGLGFILNAALGRSLGPSDFGVFYTILTISSFVGFAIDWGQYPYVIREIARGRSDEPEFVGSAMLIGTAGSACAAMMAIAIALAMGYDERIVYLAPLSVLIGIPSILYVRFSYLFRGKDLMHIDVMVSITGKALTVAATLAVLQFGGGVGEVVLAQCVGGIGCLIIGTVIALKLGFKVGVPAYKVLHELIWAGAPIVASSMVAGLQPLIEVFMLSHLAVPMVVGWYGASRTIFGLLFSPALILATASLPELSRAAFVPSELRRILETTARPLLAAAAFFSSALYLFSHQLIAIIYGRGHFEQTSLILQLAAIFLPVFFLGALFGTAVTVTGKTKELALITWTNLITLSIVNWFLIGICQAHYNNGAIAPVISSGSTELLVVASFVALLPRGAVGKATLLIIVRACITSICTIASLSLVQSLEVWFVAPLFILAFAVVALATKLIVPSDFLVALNYARRRWPYINPRR
jgi:O-antigen/teichoic acid export membrane protein